LLLLCRPDKEGKIITSKAVNAFQTKCPALDCEFECKSVEEWKDHSKGCRTFQARNFKPTASTPDFSTPGFSTMNISTCVLGLKSP
jgi:hypothetical protein